MVTTLRDKITTYVGFDQASTEALREARALVAPHFGSIIDDFYANIEAHPDARAAITGGSAQIARLKQSLLRWIDELFMGPHDEAYVERRLRIGRVHVRIELPQMYMLTAMDRIRVQTVAALRGTPGVEEARLDAMLLAIHQIMDLELAIMLESYRDDLLMKNRTAERLATIGQFAAGIGHELRNPLGVVESSAYLINQRLDALKVTDPGIKRHMEKIVTEVQRSGRTISDLLELARNRPPKRRLVDAREFVLQAIPGAHLPAAVDVSVEVPPGVPLDADPDQLGRVLINLFINAGQAMNGAGHIHVDARREPAATVLCIRDTGPGIPSPLREQVFQALFTTKAKGSGLGLALCRRIAEAHGGTVLLEPSDQGAVFSVRIPDSPPA